MKYFSREERARIAKERDTSISDEHADAHYKVIRERHRIPESWVQGKRHVGNYYHPGSLSESTFTRSIWTRKIRYDIVLRIYPGAMDSAEPHDYVTSRLKAFDKDGKSVFPTLCGAMTAWRTRGAAHIMDAMVNQISELLFVIETAQLTDEEREAEDKASRELWMKSPVAGEDK